MSNEEYTLLSLCKQYGITGKLELSHLFGQFSVESGGFTLFTENLNYSSESLCEIFPHRFTQTLAQQYGRTSAHSANQQMIANILYDNRMGNTIREGYTYRGRGVIQLTGKDNYKLFQGWLKNKSLNYDIINDPDLVSINPLKYLSGIFFWLTNNVGQLARQDNYLGVTKKINGGQIGLAERIKTTNKYKLIFK